VDEKWSFGKLSFLRLSFGSDITFGPYRSRRGHVTDVSEVDGWVVAAVVSIRSDEGSPSVWQKIAMRFQIDDGFLRTIEGGVLGTL
jgi:hypothetical protein